MHTLGITSLIALALMGEQARADETFDVCTDEIETYRSLVIHKDSSGDSETPQTPELPMPCGDDPLPGCETFLDLPIQADDFWERFSIENTLGAIVRSDPTNPASEDEVDERIEQLVADWEASMALGTTFVERPGAEGISYQVEWKDSLPPSVDILTMQPVALFNRMDMVPIDGRTCGEHRIVYQGGGGNLIIFEAKVQNPNPDQGVSGCLELAEHWALASKMAAVGGKGVDSDALGAHMEALYYEGVGAFEPAIHFNHLGGLGGQIRGNAIGVWSTPWQLREWIVDTALDDTGKAYTTLRVESVKNNALAELLTIEPGTGVPETVKATVANWNAHQENFLIHFEDDLIPNLTRPEAMLKDLTADAGRSLVGTIRAGVAEKFNEFQSENPNGSSAGEIDDNASDEIRDILFQNGWNEDHIVNRYNFAATCSGCHNATDAVANREIGPGIKWPKSFSFLHVRASGDLSEALHGTFLPARRTALQALFMSRRVDINRDGKVDVNDLLMLLDAYGGTAGGSADIDCDGGVNIQDFLALLERYGEGTTIRSDVEIERLERLIAQWDFVHPRERPALLRDIQSARAVLRAAEAALPGWDGSLRPTH